MGEAADGTGGDFDDLLEEQAAYYRARAPVYDDWWEGRETNVGPTRCERLGSPSGRVSKPISASGAQAWPAPPCSNWPPAPATSLASRRAARRD